MTANELRAIKEALSCAADVILCLGAKNYPKADFEDEDIADMFYILNTMILKLYDKIKAETV